MSIGRPTTKRPNAALRIVAIYVVVGAAWIFGSDHVVVWLLGYSPSSVLAQTIKGLAYVLATGALLYWLIQRHREEIGRQAWHAARMEMVGRVAAGIAHDFNNVLSTILGLCRLLRDDLTANQADPADVDEIRSVAEHGAALAARLLVIGRPDRQHVQRLDLNEHVRDSERLLLRSAGARSAISFAYGEDVPTVEADPLQVDQVLVNLVLNACDAMTARGQIALATAGLDLDAAAAGPLDLAPGRYAVLTVTDNGQGMDAATLRRIFEPFFSTKADRGFGIGLASVEAIVEARGGRITVASQPGQGTTFQVYLPAAP